MPTAYLKRVLNRKATPQAEPMPGSAQVPNSAGGYAFELDPFARLLRFLILGSEGGSYYATERQLTIANARSAAAAIAEDGRRAVQLIVEVSESGRAPKNGPALFALALAASGENSATRRLALEELPRVARTGTHLFEFASYVNDLRGWGKGLRRGIARWYLEKEARTLALHAVKYRQRGGWSHADLLRLSHVQAAEQGLQPADEGRNAIFHYMVDGWPSVGEQPHPDDTLRIIWAAERARDAGEAEIVRLIEEYGLPMEAVPTDRRSAAVYEALAPAAGITWLIRNLGNLAKSGALAPGRYGLLNTVTDRLGSQEELRRGRVHPLQVLVALRTYGSGRGARGSGEWPVLPELVDALDAAFYTAFQNQQVTGARYLLGLDVSGSMTMGEVAGLPGVTPRVAAAAMAMVTRATEGSVTSMAFAHAFTPFKLSTRERLDSVINRMSKVSFGGTDCALPMVWALQNRVEADVFVVYTDSETWYGSVHPMQALREYRQRMGIPARLVVVGMVANPFTIADPDDAGALDMQGFDAAAPAVMAEFVMGRV